MRRQQGERFAQNSPPQPRVVGLAERVTERRVDEQRAGRVHLACHILEHRDGHGGNAGLLYYALYQPDGLMAQRSDRGEQDGVHLVVGEQGGDLGRRTRNKSLRCRYGAHKAEVPAVDGPYLPVAGHASQVLHG